MGWDYPMHLGVTEAGEGEDGRMKSAIGGTVSFRSFQTSLQNTFPGLIVPSSSLIFAAAINGRRSVNG